jgi:hypothetical protein
LQIQLKQGGSLNPKPAAMLGCAYGFQDGAPDPVALAEYRSHTGQKGARPVRGKP